MQTQHKFRSRPVGEAPPMMNQAVPMDTPQPPMTIGLTPVRFDASTTYQSPLFWLVAGFALGFYLRGSSKVTLF